MNFGHNSDFRMKSMCHLLKSMFMVSSTETIPLLFTSYIMNCVMLNILLGSSPVLSVTLRININLNSVQSRQPFKSYHIEGK